jgi:hypothetical protein
VEIEGVEILTIVDDVCCVGFINLIGVVAGVWRQTSSFYWAHLSIPPEGGERSSLRNVVFFK